MNLITWFQGLPIPGLIPVMKGFTQLGNESFYLLALPILFWCWKKEWGLPLLLLLYVTFVFNTLMKFGFALPRPPESLWKVSADGFGFPSGHAQMAMALWGYLGWKTGHRFWAGLIIFLIGLSRIVLGVHFPTDVAGGWALGGITLAVMIWAERRMEAAALEFPPVPTAFVLFWVGIVVPVLMPDPTVLRVSGFIAGLGPGLILEAAYLKIPVKANNVRQLLKVVIGVAIALGLEIGLKKVFPEMEVFTWLRYGLMGLWIGLGAPLSFRILRLVNTREE